MSEYSVLISVYNKESPLYLLVSLNSVFNQSIRPTEVVIVEDGPLTSELYNTLDDYERIHPELKRISLKENRGLGLALAEGLTHCSYDLVARMDTDDFAVPDRFEKQLKYMEEHPECDILGGQMTEFINSPNNVVATRVVPTSDAAIKQYLKSRCPFNHITVMFRREAVLNAGNYQPWYFNEDLYLWIRMALNGCKMANLPDVLCSARVGKDMYSRRGGRVYFESEKGLEKYKYEHGMITRVRYRYNILVRWIVQIAMPNWLRGWVFRTFFRK